MTNFNSIAIALLFIVGPHLSTAQKSNSLSEKDYPQVLSDLVSGNFFPASDTLGQQLVKNKDTTYTRITYHPNGKVKSKRSLSIYYDQYPDTLHIIDPVTLDERIELLPTGYAAEHNGPAAEFDAEGNKLLEAYYINNNRDGIRREWYPNGKLKSEENYVQGAETGKWQYWYPNGTIERIQFMPVGDYKEYYENGQLKTEGSYIFVRGLSDTIRIINPITLEEELHITQPNERPEQDGEWKYYDETGKVIRRETYVKGKATFQK